MTQKRLFLFHIFILYFRSCWRIFVAGINNSIVVQNKWRVIYCTHNSSNNPPFFFEIRKTESEKLKSETLDKRFGTVCISRAFSSGVHFKLLNDVNSACRKNFEKNSEENQIFQHTRRTNLLMHYFWIIFPIIAFIQEEIFPNHLKHDFLTLFLNYFLKVTIDQHLSFGSKPVSTFPLSFPRSISTTDEFQYA